MKRFAFPLVLVLAAAACDEPPPTHPLSEAPPSPPAAIEWVKDTVPPSRYLGESAGGDFTPDTIFPFHLYWHHNGVPPRIRAAVRRAAARWASIVAPTEVLPYVFRSSIRCGFGAESILLSYARGDTLVGGFHVYVSSDSSVDSRDRAWAAGACIPYTESGWDYHPVTNAPPNGFTFIGDGVADTWWSDSHIEDVAVHELGHLLGISGSSNRWFAGIDWDYVIVDGTRRYFGVQTDSVAIRRYEKWVTSQGKRPYGLRKLPLFNAPHWHGCFLSGYGQTDVMAYNGRGAKRVITQVTASMLQGFKVDWNQFIENDPEVWQWTPDDQYWAECPQVRFLLDSIGLSADGVPTDSLDVPPNFPDLGDDVRPWTYITNEG